MLRQNLIDNVLINNSKFHYYSRQWGRLAKFLKKSNFKLTKEEKQAIIAEQQLLLQKGKNVLNLLEKDYKDISKEEINKINFYMAYPETFPSVKEMVNKALELEDSCILDKNEKFRNLEERQSHNPMSKFLSKRLSKEFEELVD